METASPACAATPPSVFIVLLQCGRALAAALVAAGAASAAPQAAVCDMRVVELLEQIPVVPDNRESGQGGPLYWETDANTSRIDYLKPYWYARADCDSLAAQAASASPLGPVYALAGKVLRTYQVSQDEYSRLEHHGLEQLVTPVLAAPGNEGVLERFARTRPRNEGDEPPLSQAFKLRYEESGPVAAVALVERIKPDAALLRHWIFGLRYGFAKYRLGQKRRGFALMAPFMRDDNELQSTRGVIVETFAQTGYHQHAQRLIAQAPARGRSRVMKKYVAAGGDGRWVQRHLGWMSTCDQSSTAAMRGHYLLAIELADQGRCETGYSQVAAQAPQRLVERYEFPNLYTIAALRGDGLVFRALAYRAGATRYSGAIATAPVAMSLIALGRDQEARAMLLEDASASASAGRQGLEWHGLGPWRWEEIALLATPSFAFEDWIDLYNHAQADHYDGSLVHLAQSFAMNQPSQAMAWYERVHARLTERQRGDASIGLVRGLLRTPLPGESEFKALAPKAANTAR